MNAQTALDIGRALARRIFATRGNHSEAHVSEAELAAMLTLAAEDAIAIAETSTDSDTVTITRYEWLAAERCAEELAALTTTARTNPYELAHGEDRDAIIEAAQDALDYWHAAHRTADPHCSCSDCQHEADVTANAAAAVPEAGWPGETS